MNTYFSISRYELLGLNSANYVIDVEKSRAYRGVYLQEITRKMVYIIVVNTAYKDVKSHKNTPSRLFRIRMLICIIIILRTIRTKRKAKQHMPLEQLITTGKEDRN